MQSPRRRREQRAVPVAGVILGLLLPATGWAQAGAFPESGDGDTADVSAATTGGDEAPEPTPENPPVRRRRRARPAAEPASSRDSATAWPAAEAEQPAVETVADQPAAAQALPTAPAESVGGRSSNALSPVVGLRTSGFVSGELSGGLFLGGRYRTVMAGLTVMLTSAWANASGVAIGRSDWTILAGTRFPLFDVDAGRLELYGQIDLGVRRTSTRPHYWDIEYIALSYIAQAGPGIRLWVTPHLALGYLGFLEFARVNGRVGSGAFEGVDPNEVGGEQKITGTRKSLRGLFEILAVF